MTTRTATSPRTTSPNAVVRVLQVCAGGAIALHVLSGLTALAAVLLRRRYGASARFAVLAVVVFVLTFVQAATGGRSTLWIHAPGAMVVTVGAAWVMVWSLGRLGRLGDRGARLPSK